MKKKESVIDTSKPDVLYRFREVRISNLSPRCGRASTATFEFKGKNKKETRWCFYDGDKYDKLLEDAIKADWTLGILIGRYVNGKVTEEFFGEDNGSIVDWLEDVWRIVLKE